jgi:hypothetical protein
MRILCPLAVILAITAPVWAATKPPVEPRDPVNLAQDDGGLGPLFHASPERVRAKLGDPDVSRSEGAGGFWTYRLPHCALFLFFHEGPRGLHVTSASTGPRRRGEPTLSVEACLASAVQLPEE